jgi:hypothetical protein
MKNLNQKDRPLKRRVEKKREHNIKEEFPQSRIETHT